MNDIKANFLWNLGIRKDNYPISFLEKIQDIRKMITTTEIGYCAVDSRCDGKPGRFCIRDVVGTDHSRYAGQTWIDAFLDLDRGDRIIELYKDNPSYWEDIKTSGNSDIGLLKYKDKYYIFSKAGGGNNRLIAMKIMYLSLINQAGNNQDEIERINNKFTFSANIRELSRDNEIPFVVVAMGEDLDGFSVKKEGDTFIVYKKITDQVLFKGDSEQFKKYFKSLFDKDIYGKELVDSRLESLENGCKFSAEKHRKVLEEILPQFKEYNQLGAR